MSVIEGALVKSVLFLFAHMFPVFSSKCFWDVFREFDFVVGRCISIPPYNELRFISLSYISCNTIDCIFVTGTAMESPLCTCSSRLPLFGIIDCGAWSVDRFFGMAGPRTTRSMKTVFSMP